MLDTRCCFNPNYFRSLDLSIAQLTGAESEAFQVLHLKQSRWAMCVSLFFTCAPGARNQLWCTKAKGHRSEADSPAVPHFVLSVCSCKVWGLRIPWGCLKEIQGGTSRMRKTFFFNLNTGQWEWYRNKIKWDLQLSPIISPPIMYFDLERFERI